MSRIIGCELERMWTSFRARPEWHTRAGHLIFWEVVQELLNRVVVQFLEVETSPLDTVLKGLWFVLNQSL